MHIIPPFNFFHLFFRRPLLKYYEPYNRELEKMLGESWSGGIDRGLMVGWHGKFAEWERRGWAKAHISPHIFSERM